MRLLRHFPLCLLLLWLAPAAATAQAPDAKSDLAQNAAVQYWQAFAQMPTLDKEQEKILQEWQTVSLEDPAVQKLLASGHNSLMYLHRGAKLERCDWGLDYNDGMSLLLPHLAKSRDLARLGALHARQEFERGNKKAARTDATAIMVLARHVGRDPIMICILVRYLIEGLVVDLVAPYVPDLKARHSEVVAMFEALPPAATVLPTIGTEKKYMAQWAIDKLKEEEHRQKGAGLALWKKFLGGAKDVEELQKIESLDEVLKLMEEQLPFYDELAKQVALPKSEFDAQYPEFQRRTKAANPIAGVLLPAVDKVLETERRNQARLALLLAATAVAESGPEKLKEIKDPFGDGPFEYRELDQGFELKSKLVFEETPVTLVVGRRTKR